jgi:hypothetical protein
LKRAFSSGCAALTGIAAISDSVDAFQPVEWRNARNDCPSRPRAAARQRWYWWASCIAAVSKPSASPARSPATWWRVHVDLGLGKVEAFKDQWARQVPNVHLEILDSPYRSLVDPVVDFVKDFEVEHRKDRNRFCVVVLPVFVTRHRWENLLHNQSTILLRSALRAQGTRVLTTVGFYL